MPRSANVCPRNRVRYTLLAGNTFQLRYQDFDWRLNDLTGGLPF